MFLPMESAYLRTKLDLGLMFTNTSFSIGSFSASTSIIMLGIDAQIALAEKFEIGILFPFLLNGTTNVSVGGRGGSSSSELGSLTLKLKGLIAGRNRGDFAVSIFSDFTLPTGTNLPSREFALWRGGVAGAGRVLPNVNVGGSLGWLWGINGTGTDLVGLAIDLFAGAKFNRYFGAQLGFEILVPVQPSGSDAAFAISPALQFFPLPNFHIDLGARIGLTDAGKIYSLLGRAALVFAAGVQY